MDVNPLDEISARRAEARAEGARLLDAAREFIGRFCVFPSTECVDAVALWAAHAHMAEHFHTSPRLAMLSPEPGSGKTRVLEVLDLLTPDSMLMLSPSVAAIFRKLAVTQVTLLFDECDAIFAKRGDDGQNEDLRALINSGYRRGASIPRCVGPKHDVEDFKVYAATALAGLGDLPDTIMSRSIVVRMRKRSAGERVEAFRFRVHEDPGHALRDRLARWASAVGAVAGAAWPELPTGVEDRKAEIWEPLIAIADQAGGHWPVSARQACVAFCSATDSHRASLGVRLLDDLRTIFADAESLATSTILSRLCGTEPYSQDGDGTPVYVPDDAPWSELRGKPLDARGLARLLHRYGVTATKIKDRGKPLQGYRREDLWDAWMRYLSPPPSSPEPVEPVEHPQQSCGFSADFEVPDNSPVPEPLPASGTKKPAPALDNSMGSGGSTLSGAGDGKGLSAPLVAAIGRSIRRTAATATLGEVIRYLGDWPADDLTEITHNPDMLDSVLIGMGSGEHPQHEEIT